MLGGPAGGTPVVSRERGVRTLLVTGGCGFIGSNFVRVVLAGGLAGRVVNLDALTYAGNPRNLADVEGDPRYRFVRGDVADVDLVARLFAEEGFDAVAHLAAESHVDRSIVGSAEFVRTNVVGTHTLLEVARRAWSDGGATVRDGGRRFLHVSTDEVYGSLGKTGRFSETTPYDPRSPYSASKAASDHLARAYFHTYGLPVLIVHASNNYGPYQFPEKLIPRMIRNALRGEPLPVYGDGGQVRDWLHVEDHCEALAAVLERGRPGRTYDVGGGNERPNLDLVTTLCAILDARVGPAPDGRPHAALIRHVEDRLGHDRRYAIDSTRIRTELGWGPRVPFEDGLRRTVDWYVDHADWVAAIEDGSYRDGSSAPESGTDGGGRR